MEGKRVIISGSGWRETLSFSQPDNIYFMNKPNIVEKISFNDKTHKIFKNPPDPFFFIEKKNSYFCGFISFNFYEIIEKEIFKKSSGRLLPFFAFYEFNKFSLQEQTKKLYRRNSSKNLIVNKNTGKDDFIKTLLKIKDHIEKGDVYVINLSQKFSVENIYIDFEDFFCYLQDVHPFPFSIYMSFDVPFKFEIISHSPECFLKKRGKKIFTYPIKGSIKRGEDIYKLLKSEKEEAELSMVVDLLRNDLSRISIPGSVKVLNHRKIQIFETITHTYSEICGILKEKTSFKDIIYSTFPGGSITGTPKIRSIQLIEEYENHLREIYTGISGILYPDGDFDFNISIRSAFYLKNKIHYFSGCGIVYDSDPHLEYEESMLKTKSFFEPLRDYYGFKKILFS